MTEYSYGKIIAQPAFAAIRGEGDNNNNNDYENK